jgi:hypothetical protein
MTWLHGSRPASVLVTAALLITACAPTDIVPVARLSECAGHPQPAMCEQAWKAVAAELGDGTEIRAIRIDPVQCANERCWTWAYVASAEGADQQMSVDWLPNGEISVGYVVQD